MGWTATAPSPASEGSGRRMRPWRPALGRTFRALFGEDTPCTSPSPMTNASVSPATAAPPYGMGTAERPSVHVRGFPVLPQLAEGSLSHVDLTAHDIPADGSTRPLPVTKLSVGLDGLRAAGSADESHARRVEATAFLAYEDVSAALGVSLSRGDEPGRIVATASLPLAGDVTVSAAVSAAKGDRMAFTDVRTIQGELIPPLKALLGKALEDPVPLENAPEGLRLRSVTATENGIDARVTGRSVTFRPRSSYTA
ncbi:DUF2993 domain-containing protein [Streptomyces lavendulae]|uniref:LmeA family phospholipid-binding protein n=1 Tax=Streptomyces lavendulae TaxID=1914 RepID=UPI003687899B